MPILVLLYSFNVVPVYSSGSGRARPLLGEGQTRASPALENKHKHKHKPISNTEYRTGARLGAIVPRTRNRTPYT